ncbi:SRPBCC domain-containing protein [Arthrobacter sp.]|uniref:SRPBCC family protein n=1 Tax=Arthrobacter sp. TaxID=1667 RepID=UPI00281184A6|nr:SRPBCC domain-containing protein [Arthrobacter sp.]
MEKLQFSTRINAPVQTVWSTMLDDATYRDWTSAFHEGSYYEGDWNQGSEIRFLGPDGNGSLGGMLATVEESRPHEFVSLRYLGQIVEGVNDTTSDEAKSFAGTHENYTFRQADGMTALDVEIEVDADSDDEFVQMFNDLWPKALDKLKAMCEREATS